MPPVVGYGYFLESPNLRNVCGMNKRLGNNLVFNGQRNTPASILLGRMNKKHDIKRFKVFNFLNLLISCFLFSQPSKMLAGVLG